PLEMARGFATIANGGFVIEPYFIRSIRDNAGQLLHQTLPRLSCPECEEALAPPLDDDPSANEAEAPAPNVPENAVARAIDSQTIWMVTDILRDVTVRGTAARVRELGRNDLAGKTGTTNDETDAWFNGFQKNVVATAWVGFDQPGPLGKGETGGRAALPMWMDFMRVALKDVPEENLPRPAGLISVRINPRSGHLAGAEEGNATFEVVPQGRVPEPEPEEPSVSAPAGESEKSAIEELF
ncbi:MAG: penicillin-binding transpeptidase domain-containing protein, partial [Dongiaceae bacterium]